MHLFIVMLNQVGPNFAPMSAKLPALAIFM